MPASMLHAEMLLFRNHLFLFHPQGLSLPSSLTQASPWWNSLRVYLVWLCPQSLIFQTSPPGLSQTGSEKIDISTASFSCAVIRGAAPKTSFIHIPHIISTDLESIHLLTHNYKSHPVNEDSSPVPPYLSQYPSSPILKANLHLLRGGR